MLKREGVKPMRPFELDGEMTVILPNGITIEISSHIEDFIKISKGRREFVVCRVKDEDGMGVRMGWKE